MWTNFSRPYQRGGKSFGPRRGGLQTSRPERAVPQNPPPPLGEALATTVHRRELDETDADIATA